jgi:hypothetical protein
MMNTVRQRSEQIGEAFAPQVLIRHFGAEVFIGAAVELKLKDFAAVVYQAIPDLEYHGATISYPTGEKFVALNTCQPLRLRYFTAAHELWHVLDVKEIAGEGLDHERAADRFATALMMPEPLVRLLWRTLKKDMGEEKAVMVLADMSAVPYEALARRVRELGLEISSKLQSLDGTAWLDLRQHISFTPSPLDQAYPQTSFVQYEFVVAQAMDGQLLNEQEAVIKLAHVSPLKAEQLGQRVAKAIQWAEQEED